VIEQDYETFDIIRQMLKVLLYYILCTNLL